MNTTAIFKTCFYSHSVHLLLKAGFFLRNKTALLIYKLKVQFSLLQSLNPVPFSFPSHFIESGGKLILWQSLGLPNFSFEIVTLFVFVNGSYFF